MGNSREFADQKDFARINFREFACKEIKRGLIFSRKQAYFQHLYTGCIIVFTNLAVQKISRGFVFAKIETQKNSRGLIFVSLKVAKFAKNSLCANFSPKFHEVYYAVAATNSYISLCFRLPVRPLIMRTFLNMFISKTLGTWQPK